MGNSSSNQTFLRLSMPIASLTAVPNEEDVWARVPCTTAITSCTGSNQGALYALTNDSRNIYQQYPASKGVYKFCLALNIIINIFFFFIVLFILIHKIFQNYESIGSRIGLSILAFLFSGGISFLSVWIILGCGIWFLISKLDFKNKLNEIRGTAQAKIY